VDEAVTEPGVDRRDDEPAWLSATTWEWEALPGQRYPGAIADRQRAVHFSIADVSIGDGRFGRPPEPRRPASDGRPRPADRRMQPPATDVPHFDLPGDRRAGTATPPPRQPPPPYVDIRPGPAGAGRSAPWRPDIAVRNGSAVPAPTSGWFATRPRPAPAEGAGPPERKPPEGPARSGDDGLAWTISAGAPEEITGEIVTGEIVDSHVSDGEVIRAEVVAAGPAVPDDGRTAPASVDAGLGRRLKMSGLGRPTAGPRPMIPPAPTALSYVEGPPDWFAATTASQPVLPRDRGNGSARRQGDQTEQRERRLADPEQLLAAYDWRLDPETLRELVSHPDQLRAVRDRLTDKVEYAERDAVRARLLSLRAVVSRLLGDLEPALADGRAALGHAEATGELRRTAIAAARLAHVLQWRGEYAEADRLFAEANSIELPDRLRAELHELAGRSAYEQGRQLEALQQFEAALSLRSGVDTGRTERVAVALDAVLHRVRERGWGPYPRSRDEILMRHQGPQPFCEVRTGLWGYAGAAPARYRDARPFAEGAAWVRRPGAHTWELIGEDGRVLIDSSAGYLGSTEFCGGLAWVSREPVGGWFAIDQQNQVIIPGGFDDVRPFQRGVAPVRRGGWGAIDRHGRMVVPPKYRAFATTLAGGRRVEGFTAEGLAVVDTGDGLGVVDQRGRVVVAPAYPNLVIHPVAFLIGDERGLWGALDRHGEPLIDVVHAGEADVTKAIDQLLADTRPVL
jgi:tetratricopeptide (TPR) repeat protein